MTAEVKESATAATKSWAQATLLINGKKVEWGTKPLLFRGEENIVTVEAPDEIARELNLVLPDDGGLNIVASPTFGNWVARVDGKFEWKIKPDADKSGRITLVFFSREMLESWEHRSLVMSSNLADEADVKIGGVAVPPEGNWFYRGAAQTVTLTPKPGSPLAGLPIAMFCSIKSGLDVANVASAPVFGRAQTTTYSWAVTGHTNSGTFQLRLSGVGMTTEIALVVSKLISSNLVDEADVKIGGAAVPEGGNWFYRDKPQTVTLIPKSDSPLVGLPIALTCEVKSGLDVGNVVSEPAFGSLQTTYSWAVTGNTKSGTFQLALAARGSPVVNYLLPTSKLRSRDLADEGKIHVDGAPVPPDGVEFRSQVPRSISFVRDANSPLNDYSLTINIHHGELLPGDVRVSRSAPFSWWASIQKGKGQFELDVVDLDPTEITTGIVLVCRAV